MATKRKADEKADTGIKKPKTAYIFYSTEMRSQMKKENPNATFGEIAKILGANWKSMSDADKAKYVKLAADDKKRYEAAAPKSDKKAKK